MKRTITICTVALSLFSGLSATPETAEVSKLLESYFEVQQELASDNLVAARKAAAAIAERAEDPNEMTAAAVSVAEADDIVAARTEFQGLSTQILALVESAGTEGGLVYLARCPMAFGGKGGTWLQDNKTIANPYFGSQMPRCGGVIKEIGSLTAMGITQMPDKQCCPK
ncbi:MAG: hypothetical protein DRI65_10395 [Chloroflexota bacterium]|nr:MAG: hypothetical protein DRI65_10395 [Chloroflexota bacterium]